MASQLRGMVGSRACTLAPEALAALVDRVCASEQFRKSPRSQDLLRFLWDHARKNPSDHVTEHAIGVALYGWDPDRDSGADTSVRVQVSHLRKKLEHHFATEGSTESVLIRIPRGSYMPMFEVREHSVAEDLTGLDIQLTAAPLPVPAKTSSRVPLGYAALACVATAVLVFGASALFFRPNTPGKQPATPAVDRFWSAFRDGNDAVIVLSDAPLILFTDILGHTVPLNDYRYSGYPARQLDTIKNPDVRRFAEDLLGTQTTGMQDSTVAGRINLLLSRYQVRSESISARDFRMPQPGNIVLLGHPKGNPWVQFFEDQLNFRYEFDYPNHRGSIANRAPAPGEQAVYTANFGNQGYCVVARLPKADSSGTVLLIFGSDMSSLLAGGSFVSDEASLQQFFARLGGSSRATHLEVLLKTQLLDNLARKYEVIAYRTQAP